MVVFPDDAFAGVALLADDVAKDAALFFVVVVPTAVHFLAYAAGDDGQGDELGMRMFDRGASGFAVILENQDVAEALIVLEVQHAVAIGPEDVFQRAFGESGQCRGVIGRFDDHLVSAYAIHFVEKTLAFAVQLAFDAQRGKFVGHHADAPAGGVGGAAAAPVDQNFGGCLRFAAGAERAVLGIFCDYAFPQEIVGALAALGGDDHPASGDGIFSQLWQTNPPRRTMRTPFRGVGGKSIFAGVELASWRKHPAAKSETIVSRYWVFTEELRAARALWWHSLDLRAEGILVQAHDGRSAQFVIDGQDIEAHGTRFYAALEKKEFRGAHQHVLLGGGYAEFGERGELGAEGAGAHLDEGQHLAIVADHVDFTFGAARMVVAGHENIAETPAIPVGIGFAADAGLPGDLFALLRRRLRGVLRRVFVAQTAACAPVHGMEEQPGSPGHCAPFRGKPEWVLA